MKESGCACDKLHRLVDKGVSVIFKVGRVWNDFAPQPCPWAAVCRGKGCFGFLEEEKSFLQCFERGKDNTYSNIPE